ncbi:MAG: hypothetical protein H0Z33_01160 [Bacillaceae bacterium]|nr:hypothetical protein [Bacillaceae bacterium]
MNRPYSLTPFSGPFYQYGPYGPYGGYPGYGVPYSYDNDVFDLDIDTDLDLDFDLDFQFGFQLPFYLIPLID